MEKQETVTDIIAAMRDEGHTGESSCLEWVGTKMRYYADRLEAAWKREKAAIEADALFVGGFIEASRKRELSKNRETDNSGAAIYTNDNSGDCAKMREALKTVKRYFDGYTVNILELRRKVDAALAKPPRNCDRFATLEDARKEHHKICEEYGACNKACGYKSGHSGTYQCFEAWLFAPAMEQEGAVS